jgi:ribosome-associated translation inhibitor RaiA
MSAFVESNLNGSSLAENCPNLELSNPDLIGSIDGLGKNLKREIVKAKEKSENISQMTQF